MSLPPSLYDMYPAPWPEDCKEHAWEKRVDYIGGRIFELCFCTICRGHKTVVDGIERPPGVFIALPQER